ncbi:hypothetical protein C7974DRAFT_408671 [Boeremia exigua]|uniref:uncharacterized protein n=1 Tax=Boeremia exigua TaxID=749465 RepID=UPI001E8E36B4|nr:uncharacterized protein C7974DRAFT_408671 [Boeremia exigua]KAH6642086.1 hypothetical protein C7974DRAFT_408671 [Boeremia exigua]
MPTLTPPQAAALPANLRNSIYSSLLSSGSIRTIESTLTQLLQSTGFQAALRAYITDLFRTGQATTANEAFGLAMGRVRECMAEGAEGANGGERNGSGDGEEGALRVPDEVVKEGCKVVRRELERVVVIEMD